MKVIKPTPVTADGGLTSSPGSYFDSNGVLRMSAANELRYDHKYVDGQWVSNGLLIEGEVQNLLTYSEQFDNAVWGKSSVTVTPNMRVAPDGTMSFDLLEKDADPYRFIGQAFSAFAGQTYTASCFVAAGSLDQVSMLLSENSGATINARIVFNISSQTFNTATASTNIVDYGFQDLGGGVFRVWITTTFTGNASPRLYIYPGQYNTAIAGNIYLGGAMINPGNKPGSYLPTTTAPATRPADVLASGRNLVYSNVPTGDYPAWASSASYAIGDRVVIGHEIYEALVANSNVNPTTDTSQPPKWLDVGAINRWRMFDNIVGTQTTNSGKIDVTIQPYMIINSLAFFGLKGKTLTVSMSDPIAGQVWSKTVSLIDTGVTDWYGYFFDPLDEGRQDLALFGLPAYGSATIRIVVDAGAETAAIGLITMGTLKTLGWANYGTSVGITDYSRKSVDDFGNYTIIERSFSKRADFDVTIESHDVSAVQRYLAKIRATPVVWIGSEDYEATILYGFFKDFSLVISNPATSQCSISVESLI